MNISRKAWRLGSAIVAVIGLTLVAAPAHADTSSPNDVIYVNKWKVTSVGSAYTTTGSWHNCQAVTKSSVAGSVTCSLSTSISNTLTGSVSASVADINASVGYSTSATTTVSTSRSFNIAAGKSGELQWQAQYTSKKVTQTEYQCLANGNGCTSLGKTAVAVASKYNQPNFRFVAS
ncbi:hypothetical protein DEI93_02180 [Curtobacterium sp. MCBD17_035]|uniref:hypothetical protein n=1 Tax=Curtobacterium sp. MCBD17_035 TaxID=2175673 RepID=UPI000DA7CCEE|nr:hypothetical protein [Curtobacterium sp. MCBD17_035]WIB67870.1 hypothetical protein DEI93_02180 [Curtobacterium sp. MCBD17_035]